VTHAAPVIHRPLARRVALTAVLAALAFALGHQIVYVLQYGPNSGLALARTGHGGQWAAAVATIVLLAALLAIAAVLELRRLARQAGSVHGLVASRAHLINLAREVIPLFLAVLAISLAVFLVVENLEYAAAGLTPPGLTLLLSAAHQETLITFELVSLVVAFVAGLYRWQRDILVKLIELAGQRACLARPHLWSRWPVVTFAAATLFRSRPPGRAPPLAV
jgi:hypothetical protein